MDETGMRPNSGWILYVWNGAVAFPGTSSVTFDIFSKPTNKPFSTPGMPTRKQATDIADRHEAARILDAEINEDEVTVHLEDGRSVTTPLEWYPRLAFATSEERQNFEIVGRGRGLHWPMLDEDLSVKGMLSGTPSAEGPRSLKGWKKALKKRRRLRAAGETPPPWGTGTYRIPYRAFLDEDTSE